MKRLFTIFFFLGSCIWAQAQSFDYGNSWYKDRMGRQFVKFIVSKDGVYRVNFTDLQAVGFDMGEINPQGLHLLYRGKEVPLYIQRDAQGLFAYLEFWGSRNDGKVDALMYRNNRTGLFEADIQHNDSISIYTDESAYYLTWSNESGLRYNSFADFNYTSINPEPSFRYTSYKEYHPDSTGRQYLVSGGAQYDWENSLNTDYIVGEGYTGPNFSGVGSSPWVQVTIGTPGADPKGGTVVVNTRIFGRSSGRHIYRLELNGDDKQAWVETDLISGIYLRTYTASRNTTLPSKTILRCIAKGASGNDPDNNTLSWATVQYDRLPDLFNKSTIRMDEVDGERRHYFALARTGGKDSLLVYDLNNRQRIKGVISLGQEGRVIIPPSASGRNLHLIADQAIAKPIVVPVTFAGLSAVDQGADFVIISHRSLERSASAYAAYRDSMSLRAKVVFVDDIYEEFGQGSLSPWAIKRFCKYAVDNWKVKPRFFLLWGKGNNFLSRNVASTVVPTFGYPASDYEFISHFDPQSVALNPIAAVGRVNVLSDEEGFNYLEKVRHYERSPWEVWMKEGAFLGGGQDALEQNFIANSLKNYLSYFEGAPTGGRTIRFQKTASSTVIDPSQAGYHDEISEGVGIIHFFGHSAANIQDVSIKEPNEYNNKGRYPMMLAFGCEGGDFTGGKSFGERWITAKQRGSIGYLANSEAGFLNFLGNYGRDLYRNWFTQQLDRPIGDILQNMLQLYSQTGSSRFNINHIRQVNLQGDPAIVVRSPQLPDFALDERKLNFEPDNFSAQSDSFRITAVVDNLGRAINNDIALSVEQKLPNGTSVFHPQLTFSAPFFSDTLSLVLKNTSGNDMAGENTFIVQVDPDNQSEEYDEDNNVLSIRKVIPGDIPLVLYPLPYAMVGTPQVRLVGASLSGEGEQNQDIGYIFEVDSTDRFDSPFKITSPRIKGSNTYVSWELPFSCEDSLTYFWRIRLADIDPSVWVSSSFTYIPNNYGWIQSATAQYAENKLEGLQANPFSKKLSFNQVGVEIEVSTARNSFLSYKVNGATVEDLGLNAYYSNAVIYTIYDPVTLQSRLQGGSPFGGGLNAALAPSELQILKSAIQNAKEGDYFLVAGTNNPQVHLWTEDIFVALRQIGVSDRIRTLQNRDSFIILGRKGASRALVEILEPNSGNAYKLTQVLVSAGTEGSMRTSPIGPALSWDKVQWKTLNTEKNTGDKVRLSVYGIAPDETEQLLFPSVLATGQSLQSIDPVRFPRLRLEANLKDSVTRTPAVFDYCLLSYVSAGDAAIDPDEGFVFRSDTLTQGQTAAMEFSVRNTTFSKLDSIPVRYVLKRPDRSEVVLDSTIIPRLAGFDVALLKFSFPTYPSSRPGVNTIIIEVNPKRQIPESYYFNNRYESSFFVEGDRSGPLLDVTFDGRKIINGEIVSPRPEIRIQIDDENTFVALSDTASFELYLKADELGAEFERIKAGDPRIVWIPAQLPENKALVKFYPGKDTPLADGIYTLRVQAKDGSGNAAAEEGKYYETDFEVENDRTMTHVLNYPNPFSTSTRFVYTLTGEELPTVFQLHIYTVSGKLVKVIDLLELGELRVGRHITNYAWDGTDELGDKLANGVYIYRTVVNFPNGYTLRDEPTAQYFEKGWGKMYILR